MLRVAGDTPPIAAAAVRGPRRASPPFDRPNHRSAPSWTTASILCPSGSRTNAAK
jgi:hypothetical protein